MSSIHFKREMLELSLKAEVVGPRALGNDQ